jgi:hypothetical protein
MGRSESQKLLYFVLFCCSSVVQIILARFRWCVVQLRSVDCRPHYSCSFSRIDVCGIAIAFCLSSLLIPSSLRAQDKRKYSDLYMLPAPSHVEQISSVSFNDIGSPREFAEVNGLPPFDLWTYLSLM